MNWKKGCLVAAAGGFVFLALLIALVFLATGGAVDSANQFLKLTGEGKVSEAYKSTSPQFQAQTDEATFSRVVKELGLDNFAEASWSNRKVESGQATLEGTITTKAGDEIPITVNLIKAGEAWKVFSLSGKQAGVAVTKPGDSQKPAASGDTVPETDALKKMATSTLLTFNQSVLKKDFNILYKDVARLWQDQTTPEELQKIFQVFIDKEVDIGGVADVDPVFSKASNIDKDGLLTLTGYYPTEPFQVNFELQYYFEGGQWKLIGINVNL